MEKLGTVTGIGHVFAIPNTVCVVLQLATLHTGYAQAIQGGKAKGYIIRNRDYGTGVFC